MGFETYDNNRSTRLKELIDQNDRVSYADFIRIKYDRQYPKPFVFSWMDINHIDGLNPSAYPELEEQIGILKIGMKADANSVGAGVFAVFYQLRKYYRLLPPPKIVPPSIIIKALKDTKGYLLKNFKTTQIQLGDYQKLVRGSKELNFWSARCQLPWLIDLIRTVKLKLSVVSLI